MHGTKSLLIAAGLGLTPSCGDLVHSLRYPSGLRPPQAQGGGMGAAAFGRSAARGTAVSALRHPASTASIGAIVLWQRPREFLAGNLPDPHGVAAPQTAAPGTWEFERLLDEQHLPQAAPGKLTWLVDGNRFFPEFAHQISSARRSIDVQVYIFDNDEIAVRQADFIKKRSSEIPVRVLFDYLGSTTAASSPPETPAAAGFVYPPDMARYFRDGTDVKVRTMPNPWLVCDHSKLHLFDGRVALMGCTNIGREYFSEWHDLMVRVEGPAVGLMQKDYNRTWRRAAPSGIFALFGKEPTVEPPASLPGQFPLRVIRTDPAAGRYEIRKSMLLGLRGARKRIWIEDPYIANDEITAALLDAVKRGVDVRLIYPGKNDSKIMDVANREFATRLVRAGGKAYVYPRMTHMKVMICDGWACVGSANLDTLSMRINRELNIAFNNPGQVNELVRQVFVPDFARSRRQLPSEAPSPGGVLAEAVSDQL